MTLHGALKTLSQQFFDLVFPISCLICRKEGEYLCEPCLAKLPKVKAQKCLVCSLPSPFGKTHAHCQNSYTIDGLVSALDYKHEAVKDLIKLFKYKFVASLNPNLTKTLLTQIVNLDLSNYFKSFAVIAVPLHKRRLSWRGFNQSQMIAQSVADQLGLKAHDDIIKRIKNTKPQAILKLHERKQNIEHAFAVNANAVEKNYLLIDDVAASGATLNEIAKTLKQGGAKEVWAATIAAG